MAVPETLKEIASIFREHGHSLYLVGGAVRDYLLGKSSHDYDFTTDAEPREVKAMFRRTIDTGIKHGTVTVLYKGGSYEITTFRIESDYSDSRHPDSVTFVRSLEEDLKRRDFTINAFACSLFSGEIIDMHSGLEDLKNKRIRAIGNPEDRFTEDALRMMRACRFSSKLGFSIEDKTFSAMKKMRERIAFVSAERIREEFFTLVDSPFPGKGLEAMRDSGLLEIVLPGLNAEMKKDEDSFTSTLQKLERSRDLGAPLSVKLATLFHSKDENSAKAAEEIMQRLKSSNQERDTVTLLVRECDTPYSSEWSDGDVKRFIMRVGKDNLSSLFLLREAEKSAACLGSGDDKELKERIKKILENKDPLTLHELAVNGRDLSGIVKGGPQMGRLLSFLLDAVIDDPALNNKESLMKMAEEKVREI